MDINLLSSLSSVVTHWTCYTALFQLTLNQTMWQKKLAKLTLWNQLCCNVQVALHLFLSAPQPPTSLFPQQRTPLATTQPARLPSHLFWKNISPPARHTTALKLRFRRAQWFPRGERKTSHVNFGCHALLLGEESGSGGERQRGRGGQSGGG